jgi:short-subunit dehydrogenase
MQAFSEAPAAAGLSRKFVVKQGMAGIITGASSGIGRALAVSLAERYQARLVINARNAELLTQTASLVTRSGGKAIAIAGDISDRDLSARLVETCLTNYDEIDLLVNNAGLAKPGPVTKLTPDDWHFVFNINFFGALYATYAALPHFTQKGAGKIVNISSVAGKVSFPGSVCYAASKFALTGMSEGMAAELQSQGIDVITVCPGWVRTEFFTNVKMPDKRNPTVIAQRKDLVGWLMRNCLSMSSEEAAREIIKACEKGGAREIILTPPGVIMDRMQGIFPSVVAAAAKRYPPDRA